VPEFVKHRARRDGRLVLAALALEQTAFAEKIELRFPTYRTPESVRPAEVNQVLETGFFRRKPFLKFIQGQKGFHTGLQV
jgi:hypothetical protein